MMQLIPIIINKRIVAINAPAKYSTIFLVKPTNLTLFKKSFHVSQQPIT